MEESHQNREIITDTNLLNCTKIRNLSKKVRPSKSVGISISVQSKSGSRKYGQVCEVCHNSFPDKVSFRRHYLTHIEETSYLCEICLKVFPKATELKKHTAVHARVFYKCKVCKKSFTKSSHLLKHSKERKCTQKSKNKIPKLKEQPERSILRKPYVCNVCPKGFPQACELKRHLLTHTKEKPHMCYICDKRFSLASSLRRHIWTHSEEKPLECEICLKKFSCLSNLRRHYFLHKIKVCKVCQLEFSCTASLKKHYLTHKKVRKNVWEDCQQRIQEYNRKTII